MTNAEFPPQRFGQYLLVEPIGAGGMAEIFRAKTFGAAGFEKEYAVKRILPNLGNDEEFLSMFVNEAKLVVDLYHANIVQVYDLGETDNCYFIAMEFVHGQDLLDLLARCAETDLKIPLKLTLYVMMEMLKGLDFAHKATDKFGERLHIIHRDVSPSNIMLSYAGDVKVGDFGVAKARTSAQLTQTGTLKGKVGYMSPEQVRGDEIDHRSDIFSAGIIFYETLTMSRLFMGGNDLDVMLKVRDADIEDELSKCTKIPPSLLEILRRALAKDIDERFQSCDELYAAVRDFVYRHDIKTSNKDLAGFMHRVFREEISAEKERRLGESHSEKDAKMAMHKAPARVTETETPAQGAKGPDVESDVDANNLSFPSLKSVINGTVSETTYRYKDALGRLYGPMDLAELQALLSSQPEDDDEAVSVNERAWQSPDDLPQLWRVERPPPQFQEREPTEVDVDPTQMKSAGKKEGGFSGDVRTEQRSGLHPTHSGLIGETSLARLLFQLAKSRAGGMLRVENSEHNKEVFLRRGNPVLVASSMPEELLGKYLLKLGVLSEEQLTKALNRLADFGGRLGDALVGDRIVSTNDLFRYLASQLQDRILNLFTWSEARWAWFPEMQPGHESVPLGVNLLDIVVGGIRSHLPITSIRQRFAGVQDDLLVAVGGRFSSDDLPLSAGELAIALSVIPNESPVGLVNSLTDELNVDDDVIWRVLYILIEFDLFQLGQLSEDDQPLP